MLRFPVCCLYQTLQDWFEQESTGLRRLAFARVSFCGFFFFQIIYSASYGHEKT